jgi:hypothetical protein
MELMKWEPTPWMPVLQCRNRDCHNTVLPQTMFFITSADIKNLGPNHDYAAYSVRCVTCGIRDFIGEELENAAKQQEWAATLSPDKEQPKESTIITSMRSMIRRELKKILKEEAADPSGTFSP